ncbi:hypothetical protein [Planomicrobium okeanokoites]|uniref:hypothetical protein n=1 Tax=Planomicrobium okeanokoites TaxID=244 RepID=UPI0015C440F8|nr:hypothetical protein [Planomicrobium okeanokoites]
MEDNKKHRSEEEATQANLDIQEELDDNEKGHDETSSPVPFVANNTAPLMPDKKKKEK